MWRQVECLRNHYNAWAKWVLINRVGLSPRSASEKLTGLKVPELSKLCKKHRIDLEQTPAWEGRGVVMYFENYTKRGYNPVTKKSVAANRRRIEVECNPPSFCSKDGGSLVRNVLSR